MSTITLPAWLAEPEQLNARIVCIYGGRGSGKSWGVARRLLLDSMQMRTRILCCRELQVSIRDSVLQLLREQITKLALDQYFDVGETYVRCKATGSDFIFKGLRNNASEIKSTEGIGRCWVEEAQAVSEESWDYLLPTIRDKNARIYITFNPRYDSDPTYKRFVANDYPGCYRRLVNYTDNPWFPETSMPEQVAYLKSTDYDAYRHIWLGDTIVQNRAQVIADKVEVNRFEPAMDWDGPYFGLDFGYAADPTACTKCWIHGRTLYVEHEAYGLHVDMDALPSFLDTVPDIRRYTVRCDKSRPETIAFLTKRGFRAVAAQQRPGSVVEGIAHLRSFDKIVVHPQCTNTLDESRLWQYKVDRQTGDIMPDLKPGNDHAWDSIRYALEPLLGGRQTKKPEIVTPALHWHGNMTWMG